MNGFVHFAQIFPFYIGSHTASYDKHNMQIGPCDCFPVPEDWVLALSSVRLRVGWGWGWGWGSDGFIDRRKREKGLEEE